VFNKTSRKDLPSESLTSGVGAVATLADSTSPVVVESAKSGAFSIAALLNSTPHNVEPRSCTSKEKFTLY
jgi:hypothetical protein